MTKIMKEKSIYVDLEIAQKLKKKGFKQEGFFWWIKDKDGWFDAYWNQEENQRVPFRNFNEPLKWIVAPTAQKILKELPIYIDNKNDKDAPYCLHMSYSDAWYLVYESYTGIPDLYRMMHNDNDKLCDALAKMWIKLKEKKIII